MRTEFRRGHETAARAGDLTVSRTRRERDRLQTCQRASAEWDEGLTDTTLRRRKGTPRSGATTALLCVQRGPHMHRSASGPDALNALGANEFKPTDWLRELLGSLVGGYVR